MDCIIMVPPLSFVVLIKFFIVSNVGGSSARR